VDLHVTIVTPGTFPIPSDTTSSVESTIMSMAPYLAKQVPLTILGKRFPKSPPELEKDGVRYVNFSPQEESSYLNQVIHYLKKNPTNIVQIENRPQYIRSVKESVPDSKMWLVLHSITFLQEKYIDKERLQHSLELVDLIIVNSSFMREYVEQLVPGLSLKIAVNHLGVDEKRFASRFQPEVNKVREKELKRLGIGRNKVILYVGRLRRIKGVHKLLKSIFLLKKRYPSFILLVVGGSGYGQNIPTHYVRKLRSYARKLEGRVHFIPYVPSSEIHRWYRLADIVVVPSVAPEAFGLVNVEAMSTGIPVVASAVGGIPEVIEDGKNGVLVPLTNHTRHLAKALYKMLTNEKWAKELGREGREKVQQHFTWEKASLRLLELYQKENEQRREIE
jgi:spore coat protein SA